MFQKILLATDGSSIADRAAEKALELASEITDAHITVLHISSDAPNRTELMKAHMDVKFVLESKAHKVIQKTTERLEEAGVPFALEVGLGEPADKIVKYAKDHEMELIIIGSRGLGGINSVLLGSVSQRVTQQSSCPVMIVK